jgi:type IV pilus assembly protein PilZ
VIEKRRYARASINLPIQFALKGGSAFADGLGKDVSVGGMLIEAEVVAPFNAEIVIRMRLTTPAGSPKDYDLPAVVRWVRAGGMGVQFGLLGAHETHAITELHRKAAGESGDGGESA